MISNRERTRVLSSMGWVDGDALWLFDVPTGRPEAIPLSTGARYASIHAGGADFFSATHHFDGRRFEITVRSFSSPSEVLARVAVDEQGAAWSGDFSAWATVPRLYVEYLGFQPWQDFTLLEVSSSAEDVRFHRLAWYDESYDKLYQGVIGVTEIPNTQSALVSVQRSSWLVLHDLTTDLQIKTVDLAGRHGNPRLELRDSGRELWASDYDTLVVLRCEDWRILRTARLQGARAGTLEFIGDFSFAANDGPCVVARPFSGDVVAIDARTLKIRQSARLLRQPLEAIALPNGEIVARDWKTGDLLRGSLRATGS